MIRREKSCSETRALSTKKGSGFMYVGRPSAFGNPYVVGRDGHSNAVVVGLYEDWFYKPEHAAMRELFVKFAREQWNPKGGLVLLCWCGPREVCHADVLVGYLNQLIAKKGN